MTKNGRKSWAKRPLHLSRKDLAGDGAIYSQIPRSPLVSITSLIRHHLLLSTTYLGSLRTLIPRAASITSSVSSGSRLIKSSKFFGARLRQAFGAAGPAEKLSKKRRANARRSPIHIGFFISRNYLPSFLSVLSWKRRKETNLLGPLTKGDCLCSL